MVVEMVPLKGGIGSIFHPPEGNIQVVYKWYILPIGGLYATYQLLGEPFQQPLIISYHHFTGTTKSLKHIGKKHDVFVVPLQSGN